MFQSTLKAAFVSTCEHMQSRTTICIRFCYEKRVTKSVLKKQIKPEIKKAEILRVRPTFKNIRPNQQTIFLFYIINRHLIIVCTCKSNIKLHVDIGYKKSFFCVLSLLLVPASLNAGYLSGSLISAIRR